MIKQNSTILNVSKIIVLLFSLIVVPSYSQNTDEPKAEFSKAIEDNSYLIEEAYNQEKGIVQHIFTGMQNFTPIKDWEFSFTQEWPMWGQTSQFSYTVLYNSYSAGDVAGLGDLLLNYRYQLYGKDDFAAVSPRISVILPVGDQDKGLGDGTLGVQFNLPISKRLSESFTAHFNLGYTMLPGYKTTNLLNEEISNTVGLYNAGASIIWLASYNLNFMFEVVMGNDKMVDMNGDISYFNQTIINPGFRYAIDIGELQVVPGVAFPITFVESESTSGIFLYLSLEHPF